MKGAFTIKCINTSIIYSQNGNVDSVKALARNDDGKVAKIFGQRGHKWCYINRSLKTP